MFFVVTKLLVIKLCFKVGGDTNVHKMFMQISEYVHIEMFSITAGNSLENCLLCILKWKKKKEKNSFNL